MSSKPNQKMICICFTESQIHECTCDQPQQQKEGNRSQSRNRSSDESMDISLSMDDSVYELANNTSILEVPDDPSNARVLGMTYRVASFR